MKKNAGSILLLIIITACGTNKKIGENKKNSYILNKYASILKVPKIEISNVKLYSFIDDWYGTKYKYGGLSKQGVDCSGFTNILYKEVYNKHLERRSVDIAKSINKVKKSNLKEGDLVFFTINNNKNSHVGVYLKNKKFVHASTSKGVIISSLENPYYQKTYSKGGNI